MPIFIHITCINPRLQKKIYFLQFTVYSGMSFFPIFILLLPIYNTTSAKPKIWIHKIGNLCLKKISLVNSLFFPYVNT